MLNPFSLYILSFLGAIGLYVLNFSSIYPKLSLGTITFFIITFVIAGYFAIKSYRNNELDFKKVRYTNNIFYITMLILLGYIAEFIYAKEIPLFSSSAYIEFTGIPTFHVILYTFNIFFAVYLFHVIISTKDKFTVLLFLLLLIPSILLVSRGMLVNIFIGAFFIIVYRIGNNIVFYKRHWWKFVAFGLVFFFLFGMSGNIRNNKLNESEDLLSSEYIMDVGGATEWFRNSIIPKEFFWGYIYISSPLANLQKNINEHKPQITTENTRKFLANEVVIDFLSKRILKEDYMHEREILLITPSLTVGTFYAGAYYYLGWLGMIIMFGVLMLGSYIYMRFLSPDNPFKLSGVAMLCNLVALCAFSNMVIFSGMSFQLAYPILWEFVMRIRKRYKRE